MAFLKAGYLLKNQVWTSQLWFDCLKNGAADSRQMENRATIMSQDKFDCGFDFGFARDWIFKGLGFYLDEAERQSI